MTKGYVEKVEMDEEEKWDFDKVKPKLRETEFLKRSAEYETEVEQIDKVEEECKKLGKDVRDTFHVVGTTSDGDTTYLHFVASGKEGTESARKILTEVAESKNLEIVNKTTRRYDAEEDKKELREIAQSLMRWYESLKESKHLKGGD